MPTTATRLITLILLLERQPNQKAGNLAAALGISVRTLHRYFGMLDDMGIPIYSERGPLGGFSLVRGYKMPPLVFTPEEAVTVALGTGLVGEMWGRLYEDAARSAQAKLENLLPEEQRQEISWARRSLVTTGLQRADPSAQAGRLELLRGAMRDERRVEMVYQSADKPAAEERKLDPFALAYRWGWWYVVGFCSLRREVRIFRLDRIRSLALTEEHFAKPDDFDARAFMAAEFQGQPQIRVRMRFASAGAFIARANASSWAKLEESADGSVEVETSAPDLIWAASTALAYGPLVTVLEPEEVRRTVASWAQEIAGQYQAG